MEWKRFESFEVEKGNDIYTADILASWTDEEEPATWEYPGYSERTFEIEFESQVYCYNYSIDEEYEVKSMEELEYVKELFADKLSEMDL